MVTATFGSKKFQVSNKIIYTPSGVNVSEELDIEETEVSGKKPTVKIKGIKLKSLSFDVKLDARFMDVVKEIKYWRDTLYKATSDQFHLGNFSIGKFFLVKYDLKNITINKNGEYTAALLTLSFAEDGGYFNSKNIGNLGTTKKANDVKSSASSTSGTAVRVGSYIKPKSGARWYETAEGALKKSGKSGKAYQKNMPVQYIYNKDDKCVCVNPSGLGWLKIEDVKVVEY